MTLEEYEAFTAEQATTISELTSKVESLEQERAELQSSLQMSRDANDKLLKLVPTNFPQDCGDVNPQPEPETSTSDLIYEYLESKGVKRNG